MMVDRMLRIVLAGLVAVVIAAPSTASAYLDYSMPVVILGPVEGTRTLIFEELLSGGPSITRRLLVSQSADGGNTWSPPQGIPHDSALSQPRIVTSFQAGASLLQTPMGGYLLFHHFGGAAPSDIRRTPSADGLNFPQPALVDLGWPNLGSPQAGSGFPSVVPTGAASMAMLYQRFVADGPSPAGLYLSRSSDLGLHWLPYRILVATDVQLGTRSNLAYRGSDGRYLATYLVYVASGDNRVVVKATDSAGDWSAPAVLEILGDNRSPSLALMPDGAFILFYGRIIGAQSDIFSRRSLDGIQWSEEIRITDTPDNRDSTPFAVPGSSPGVVELYWSRTPDLKGSGGTIVHDPAVVVFDPVYASGFD